MPDHGGMVSVTFSPVGHIDQIDHDIDHLDPNLLL